MKPPSADVLCVVALVLLAVASLFAMATGIFSRHAEAPPALSPSHTAGRASGDP